MKPRAHLGLYDGAAEMEVGHLLAELHTGRFTATSFDLVTVAESAGGLRRPGGRAGTPGWEDCTLASGHWPAGSATAGWLRRYEADELDMVRGRS